MPFKKKIDIKNNLKPLTQQKINKKGLKASSPINGSTIFSVGGKSTDFLLTLFL